MNEVLHGHQYSRGVLPHKSLRKDSGSVGFWSERVGAEKGEGEDWWPEGFTVLQHAYTSGNVSPKGFHNNTS